MRLPLEASPLLSAGVRAHSPDVITVKGIIGGSRSAHMRLPKIFPVYVVARRSWRSPQASRSDVLPTSWAILLDAGGCQLSWTKKMPHGRIVGNATGLKEIYHAQSYTS
jgi:hypothetical protein